jgi:hypothetical protein
MANKSHQQENVIGTDFEIIKKKEAGFTGTVPF